MDTLTAELRGFPKGVVFSVSNLDAFELCPRNYEASHVTKTVAFESSDAMEAGKETHKQLENYVMMGTPLPLGLTKVKAVVDAVCADAIDIIPERRVALTAALEPVGFFHDDVAYRGIIDLTVIRKKSIIILDYKTSNEPRETFLQLKLNSTAVLMENPSYDTVHMMYVYTKFPHRRETFTRDDLPAFLGEVYPRVERLRLARAEGNFPPIPSWKCRFCKVKTCPHNKNEPRN